MKQIFGEWVECLEGEEEECKDYLLKWKKFFLRKLKNARDINEQWILKDSSGLNKKTIGIRISVNIDNEITNERYVKL